MIKTRFLAIVGIIGIVVALYFIFSTAIFLSKAEEADGQVESISSYESRCGGGKRRRSYPCTKFRANVRFFDKDESPHMTDFSAGSSRGNGRPTSEASYKIGEQLTVLYDPKNPSNTRLDTFLGVWGTSSMTLGISILAFLLSLLPGKSS